jgi:DNA-binding NtrC family response regulator
LSSSSGFEYDIAFSFAGEDLAVVEPIVTTEPAYVRRVLEHTGGKRMAAAQLLGISYPTFLKRLRELDLDRLESGVHPATTRSNGARRAP